MKQYNTRLISFRLPKKLDNKIERIASKNNTSASEVIRYALDKLKDA